MPLPIQPAAGHAPQWSPLSTSGATDPRGHPGHAALVAAMEPALDERGDVQDAGLPPLLGRAAMEPALDERGDCSPRSQPHRDSGAAMEPALDERGDGSRNASL